MNAPRKVALIGSSRTGKTLFAVRNARGGIYAIDPEHSLAHYAEEARGEIYWPSTKGRIDPLTIEMEAEDKLWDMPDDTAIIVDSVSRIYGKRSRLASMAGDLTAQERERRGLDKNAASLMKGKAHAVQVLGGMAVYGKDLYLIWHQGEGLDVNTYKMVLKETISDKEREVLMRDIDIVLIFTSSGSKYSVTVAPDTRGRGLKLPRTGFTITDPPGNFWKGTMDYLEELIYLHFDSPDHAQQWAAEGRLKGHDDIAALYETAKEAAAKKAGRDQAKFDASYMWFYWMQEVYRQQFATGDSPSKNERPDPDPIVVPPKPPATPEPEKVPVPEPEIEESDPVPAGTPEFTDSPEVAAQAEEIAAALDDVEPGAERHYRDPGETLVEEEDLADFLIYESIIGQVPFERKMIYVAKDTREAANPGSWKLPE